MTRRTIKVNKQQYNVIRSRSRTTITQTGRKGIITWHKNRRTIKASMKESRFRIERKIVKKELAPAEEKPKEEIKGKIKYRSLLAISYDTPLGKVIDCRVWIHTDTASITNIELEQIMRDFLEWLFEMNETAAMKIQEKGIEYDRELNREIEIDEIQPPDAPDNERYGWANLKGSYNYYAQGTPFHRIEVLAVPS